MQTHYQSKYLTIRHDKESNILYVIWNTPESMLDETYREEFKKVEQTIIEIKPANILAQTEKLRYIVPIDTQQWITSKLNNLHKLYEIKKVAVIMSIDFLAQISSELISEEIKKNNTKTLFFENEIKAIRWINEITTTNEEKAA